MIRDVINVSVPSRAAKGFSCPFCDFSAGQDWAELSIKPPGKNNDFKPLEPYGVGQLFDDDFHPPFDSTEWVVPGRWARSKCYHCSQIAIWRGERLVYPNRRASGYEPAHQQMPDDVATLYNEARAVVGISRRAGAALARAALELLVKHLDADASGSPRLDERIARLHRRVSQTLWELLTVLRHAGNKSLHVESEPDAVTVLIMDPQDEAVLPVLFGAINQLVEELIARPKLSAALLEQLPERVREDARRKAAETNDQDS